MERTIGRVGTAAVRRHALLGVVIGFALSVSFFVFQGAFHLTGFFLWSIVGGGGGAILGGYLAGRLASRAGDTAGPRYGLIGAAVGAVVVRVSIFLLFGSPG